MHFLSIFIFEKSRAESKKEFLTVKAAKGNVPLTTALYCNGPGWLGDVTLPVYTWQSNKQQKIWQVLVAELWASGLGA